MTTFNVNTGAIDTTKGTYSKSSQAIQDEIALLTSAASQLTSGDWRGPAADEFQHYYSIWQGVASKVQISLTGMADALSKTSGVYQEMETNLVQSWSAGQ